MRYILGVDFDNTLVDYGDIFLHTALRMGFLKDGVVGPKKRIRDAVRRLPDGEIKWRKVQAHTYGRAMEEAVLVDGVDEFFRMCRRENIAVYVVSHKTEFAAQDTEKINLRAVALEWMTKKGFFERNGLGFLPKQIYFESTQQEKVERIRQLGCTHFIDDLEETFRESMFPENICKILYDPQRNDHLSDDIMIMRNWREIYGYFFNRGR